MTDRKDRIEQTLEMLVLAPIGAGLYLKDMGPTFVNMFVARGRAEVDRRQAQVQRRTSTAKSIGQVAVAFGVPMVRQRVGHEVDSARQRAQTFLGSIGGSEVGPRPAPRAAATPAPAPERHTPPPARHTPPAAAAVAPAASAVNGSGPGSDDSLPIPGYDALSASQVVERLAGLSSEELGAVRSYEGTHRNRRTILGKIDQISA